MFSIRITVDIDTKNPIVLLNSILRGLYKFHKFPYIEKSSKKGYHLIWYGIDVDLKKSYVLRKLLGDDENRIRLDMASDKRIQQVLFNKKRVIYFDT